MSRDYKMFGLRMPPDLRAQLEKSAERSGRSLNSEIVSILYDRMHGGTVLPPGPIGNGPAGQPLSDYESILVRAFRTLPVEKQMALVTFIKI